MVDGLEEFIDRHDIKTQDGKLVLYKAVSKEYGSLWIRYYHNGTHGHCGAYKPGTLVTESARDLNTNRNESCGTGLHVGTFACAESFAAHPEILCDHYALRRIVQVLVDPDDVVCVPFEALLDLDLPSAHHKIRCRRLLVVAEIERKEM